MHGTVFVQAGRDVPTDLLPKIVSPASTTT
jgi:hypothetical protein